MRRSSVECATSTVVSAVRLTGRMNAGTSGQEENNGRAKVDEAVPRAAGTSAGGDTGGLGLVSSDVDTGVAVPGVARRAWRACRCTMGRTSPRSARAAPSSGHIVGNPWPGWKAAPSATASWGVSRCTALPRTRSPMWTEVDIHLNPKVGRDWCLPGLGEWW